MNWNHSRINIHTSLMERQRAASQKAWMDYSCRENTVECVQKAQYKAPLCECDLQSYTVKDNPGAAAGGVGGPRAVIDL